jgi:carboxylesterase type B
MCLQALGDRLFNVDVGRLAQAHAQRSGQPVYVYRFSHRATFSLSDFVTGTKANYGKLLSYQNV